MRHDPEPAVFAIHPVIWAAAMLTGALLWCASFKILVAFCRLVREAAVQ